MRNHLQLLKHLQHSIKIYMRQFCPPMQGQESPPYSDTSTLDSTLSSPGIRPALNGPRSGSGHIWSPIRQDLRPDGFPIEYFRCYHDLLVPHLLAPYKEALSRGSFPPDFDKAAIVVLPKAGLPSDQCYS